MGHFHYVPKEANIFSSPKLPDKRFIGYFIMNCSFLQSMEPIKVEELKTEKCCRISAEDLIELGELCGPASSKSPTKRRPNSKPVIIVIDIRNPEEYPYIVI